MRRRRTAVLAGAVAAVAVVVGGSVAGAALLGGDAGNPSPTDQPSVAPTTAATPAPPSRAEIRRVLRSGPVEYDGDGRLVVAEGVTVLQRLDNPFNVAAPRRSVSVSAKIDGAVYWFAHVYAGDGSSNGTSAYSGDFPRLDLARWTARQSGIAEQDDEWPGIPDLHLVRFADGEQLEPLPGVTLVRQLAHPDLGPAWAGPDDRSAVAEVTSGGERYYVLARLLDGKPQYIAVPEADGGATLEDFLALARDQYAEGGGGLL